MLTPWELEEETVRPATPVEIQFEVLDDEKNVVYPLDGGAAEGRITPGSEDQVARLLSPYVLGLQEGESMRTAQLDNPFGEPNRYEIQRTIWTGNKTQTIDASAVDHVPVGEEFVVEPINITAVLVERGESTAKVEYQISDSHILHPSNLNLSVTSDEGNVRIALDHEEGETLKLRDGCRDLLGIPAGWFRFDRVDRSHAYVTYYPVQDAGTFEAAAALTSSSSYINFTVGTIHSEDGDENRADMSEKYRLEELPQNIAGTDQIIYDENMYNVSSNHLIRES